MISRALLGAHHHQREQERGAAGDRHDGNRPMEPIEDGERIVSSPGAVVDRAIRPGTAGGSARRPGRRPSGSTSARLNAPTDSAASGSAGSAVSAIRSGRCRRASRRFDVNFRDPASARTRRRPGTRSRARRGIGRERHDIADVQPGLLHQLARQQDFGCVDAIRSCRLRRIVAPPVVSDFSRTVAPPVGSGFSRTVAPPVVSGFSGLCTAVESSFSRTVAPECPASADRDANT